VGRRNVRNTYGDAWQMPSRGWNAMDAYGVICDSKQHGESISD
jgi:hypothetical protein